MAFVASSLPIRRPRVGRPFWQRSPIQDGLLRPPGLWPPNARLAHGRTNRQHLPLASISFAVRDPRMRPLGIGSIFLASFQSVLATGWSAFKEKGFAARTWFLLALDQR